MSEDRAAEGLEHLQAAAVEMIAAARAFLDVAEDLVTDPDRVAGTVASWLSLLDLLRPRTGPAAEPDRGADAAEPAPPRIRRLDLS